MHDVLSPEVTALLERAQAEARALGHGYVGTEHILVALIPTNDIFARQGVTADSVRAELQRMFTDGNWNPYVSDDEALAAIGVDAAAVRAQAESDFGEGAASLEGPTGLTKRLFELIESAIAGRESTARADDILRAVVSDDESIAARLLAAVGADVETVRAALGPSEP